MSTFTYQDIYTFVKTGEKYESEFYPGISQVLFHFHYNEIYDWYNYESDSWKPENGWVDVHIFINDKNELDNWYIKMQIGELDGPSMSDCEIVLHTDTRKGRCSDEECTKIYKKLNGDYELTIWDCNDKFLEFFRLESLSC